MELRVLGPIEVRHDGTPVQVRGTKPRELLALLAIRPNRPVTADQLIEELWQGSPPPSAATALRVHIGRLRQSLELDRNPSAPSARLPAGPHGYVLRIEPDELDSHRFERLVVMARAAVAGGDPAGAVPCLTQALDLWRGPAYSDVADLAAAGAEIARLDDLRGLAIEELAEARLALGEHTLVVDLVSVALEQFPLRERLTASLVLALYRSGRQVEALRAYAELALRLEELGLSPSPELRRLEEDVLLQRSSLDFGADRAVPHMVSQARAPIGRFIGRRVELRRLLEALDSVSEARNAAESGAALVLVTGAAGVGKTTLTEEFCAHAERRAIRVLVGHCDPQPGADYQPVVEILRQVVEQADPVERASLPAPLGLMLPDLVDAEAVRDDAPDGDVAAQFRLFEAVTAALSRLADRPLVLIVEDLHWADRPTLRLLRYLVRHPDLAGMLVVATTRDEIDGERAESIERIARSTHRTKIELTGFDDHEVRALVRATAPPETLHSLVDLAAALRDVTGGNPFFLRELLRELDEHLVKLDDAAEVSKAFSTIAPVGVRALVDLRLVRMTESAGHAIRAAAVLGRDLTVDLLAAICEMSQPETLEALEEGLAARLLIEDYQQVDRYVFPHALVRNAVYATMADTERWQLHRRVAEVLEAETSESTRRSADIAHHFVEAAPLGLDRNAAAHAERAGDEAATRFAFAEAARWYEQAVELHHAVGTSQVELGRLHLALGRTLVYDKQGDRARSALATASECARASADPTLLADVALASDNPWALGSDYQPDARALLEEALCGIDEADTERRVRLLEGISTSLYYVDAEREGTIAFEALEAAERSGSPVLLASAYRAVHLWQSHLPEARRERLAIARRAHGLADAAAESPGLRLVALRNLLVDLLENAAVDEFDAALDDYERSAQSLGSPRDIYWSMALRATQRTMHGDLAAAEQLARGAMLRGHELDQISEGAYFLQRFVLRYQQARLAEEAPTLQAIGAMSTVYRAGAALHAIALAETGQPQRALAVARTTLGPDGSLLRRDAFWVAGCSLLAGVAARVGDLELSALLRGFLEPCADHVVLFGAGGAVLGTGHQWLGLAAAALGDTDDAVAHFAEAAAIATRISAPYWIAQSRIDAAAALSAAARAKDAPHIEQLVTEALAIARPRDFGRIVAQAEALR